MRFPRLYYYEPRPSGKLRETIDPYRHAYIRWIGIDGESMWDWTIEVGDQP